MLPIIRTSAASFFLAATLGLAVLLTGCPNEPSPQPPLPSEDRGTGATPPPPPTTPPETPPEKEPPSTPPEKEPPAPPADEQPGRPD